MGKNIRLIAIGVLSAALGGCESPLNPPVSPTPSAAPTAQVSQSPSPSETVTSPSPSAPVQPQPSPSTVSAFSGWTEIPVSRPVYVSTSGKDSNPGTEALPIQSPLTAMGLLNQNKANAVLFKRGDTFALPATLALNRGGQASAPVLLGAYGAGDRPLLTISTVAIQVNSKVAVSHFAIVGLHLKGSGQANSFGVRNVGGGEDALIEDCFIENFYQNIGFDPQLKFKNFKLRRSIITDATAPDASMFSQGIYISKTDGILFQENFFDRNGYNGPNHDIATMYNHHVYIQEDNTANNVLKDNIFTRGQDAVQVRPGGTFDGNLLAWSAINITYRQANGLIANNVILDGNDINPTTARGFGVYMDTKLIQDPTNKLLIQGNILAREHSAKPYGAAMQLENNASVMQVKDNVISAWRGGVDAKNSKNVTVSGTITGPFVDPARGIESYAATLGLPATMDAFVSEEKKQSRANWRTSLMAKTINAYVKAGFQVKP